jgi:adenosine 3'-phospho 5'-phosphosulfate transporter B2
MPYNTEEMLLLATNFLLYVAMIIITSLVAKYYFPWTMDGTAPPTVSSETSSNAVSPNRPSNRKQASQRAQQSLDSDSDEDEQESSRFLSASSSPSSSLHNNLHNKEFIPVSLNHIQTTDGAIPVQLDPPMVVFRRLMFCSMGLITTFVIWGVLQERICAHRYPRVTGDFFPYTYFLVFTNRLWSLLFSVILINRSSTGWRWIPGVLIYEYSFPSISNMLSSWCQYEALKYVTFPAQTLFKSFKLGPVMLMGKLLTGRTYPVYDYITVGIVGVGISLFMLGSPENVEFDRGIHSNEDNAESSDHPAMNTGIILLFLFLVFDSFTGQFQSRMFQKHKLLSVPELLFATNAFSTVLSLITLVHTDELKPALEFVTTHTEIHLHFFLFSVCSTIGQLLIFYTIKNFGAVIFAVIMVVRVLCSILISCIIYEHEIDAVGLSGLFIVMFGVLYRVKMKAEGKQLIVFAGVTEGEGKVMVNEWHEHLDL